MDKAFCFEQAALSARAASEASLPSQRAKFLEAQRTWMALATQADVIMKQRKAARIG